jgi:hypothetical protein
MFGFWTEQYLSTLGQGSGGGGGIVLAEPLQSINSAGLGTPQTANVGLVWNGSSWVYGSTSGGTDMSTVWANLAVSTNEQINVSHLTTALSGYASISLVDGRLSMNYDTNGNNVDFNAITYNASTGIVIQPIHVPNYSGCSNYPFNQYGTLVTFSGSTYFPFQLASYQGGALYYRADNYQPTSSFKFNNSTGWVRLIDSSNIGSQSVNYATSAGSAAKLSTARSIWGQIFNGEGNVNGLIYITANDNTVTIGSQNNSWCHIYNSADIPFIFNKAVWTMGALMPYNGHYNIGDSSNYWGTAYVSNLYSMGYVTALSDERKKNVVEDVELSVEQVAEAPSKKFTWKDKHDEDIHVGSIAQYWHNILPETVIEKDDVLSMDYSVISLASVIATARKVVDHEKRIAELERENKELKLKLNIA